MTERNYDPHYHTDRVQEMVTSKRHIDVVIRFSQNPKTHYASVEMKTGTPAPILAFAAPQNAITIGQMLNGGHNRTAPIIPLENDNPTLEDIAKALPGFFHEYYPQADGYPIRIFEEEDSNEPLFEVRITNNLVTVNKQSTSK